MPIIIAFIIFNPIWKPHILPIEFIAIINSPPKIELKISFISHFIGTMKIFPIINKKHIHAKKIIVLSIFFPFTKILIFNLYENVRTNMTHPTSSFSIYNFIFASSIMSKNIPFLFANFIK